MKIRPNESREEYKERCRIYMNDWRTRNYEREYKKRAAYYQSRKDKVREQRRKWRETHKDYISAYNKKWSDCDRVRQYQCEFKKRQYEQNLHHRIKELMRSRIHTALRKQSTRKLTRTESLIGCTVEFLKGYLQGLFKDGMTWENQGKWHIDHIIPCAEFDLTKPEQQKMCFHYSNLQPLWGIENIKKGAKLYAKR